jgi:pimeloyl-ACP methyl ester carboxylesterase
LKFGKNAKPETGDVPAPPAARKGPPAPPAPQSLAEWQERGEPVLWQYVNEGGESQGAWIFTRIQRQYGVEKPWLTVLHGFPTSSYDFVKLAAKLVDRYHLLFLDFMGFGASDKPRSHRYSLLEQADIVEHVWANHGIESTALLAHDYGGTVAQELIARQEEGTRLAARITGSIFLNSGLDPDYHRPRPLQQQLARPVAGALIVKLLNETKVMDSLEEVMVRRPGAEERAQIWAAISHEGGHRNAQRLLRYLTERQAHKKRWIGALERARVPLAFIWGMADPVCGPDMVARLKELCPRARFTELADIGHYPQVEAPDEVLQAILGEDEAEDGKG